MTTGELPRWASASLDGTVPPPVVLLLGGFLTSPPLYRPFVRRLQVSDFFGGKETSNGVYAALWH